jgi:hypothetical protein
VWGGRRRGEDGVASSRDARPRAHAPPLSLSFAVADIHDAAAPAGGAHFSVSEGHPLKKFLATPRLAPDLVEHLEDGGGS